MRENRQKFSIRKFSVGVSSIVIASLFFIGAGTTHAEENDQSQQSNNSGLVDKGQKEQEKVDQGQQETKASEDQQNEQASDSSKDESNATSTQNQTQTTATKDDNQDVNADKDKSSDDTNTKNDEAAQSEQQSKETQNEQNNDNQKQQEQDKDAQTENKADQSQSQTDKTQEQQANTKDTTVTEQQASEATKDNNEGKASQQNTTAQNKAEKSGQDASEQKSDEQTQSEAKQDDQANKDTENSSKAQNADVSSEDKSEANNQSTKNDSEKESSQLKEDSKNESNEQTEANKNTTDNNQAEPQEQSDQNKVTSAEENQNGEQSSTKEDSASYNDVAKLGDKDIEKDKDGKSPTEGIKSLKNNAVATTNNKETQKESQSVSDQPGKSAKQGQYKNQDPIILVHGFNGFTDDKSPVVLSHYWGGDKLDITQDLEKNGYKAYEASIGALSSNYDRAVELYYYIKGGQVDYGAAHAAKYGHERYGKTYEGVYKDWQPGQKVHLVGHSMGGQTVRQLEELLRNGNQEEIDYQKEHGGTISPLFQGGQDNMVSSITTLGTPHNGTPAADELGNETLVRQIVYDFVNLRSNKVTNVNFGLDQWGLKQRPNESFNDYVKRVKETSKVWTTKDNGFYDLTTEGATELNRNTSLNPNIVYKTYTGEATHTSLFDRQRGDLNLFLPFSITGNVIGKTKDKDWRVNDGLVSVISSQHPFNQDYTDATDEVQKGLWQVTPVKHGWDHVDFVGQDSADFTHSQSELHDFWQDLAADLVRDEQVTN
jgi:triacylglycerol lipase